MAYPEQLSNNQVPLNGTITDVSTAGQIFIPVPFRYRALKVQSALNGTIATADAVLTVKINGVSVGTITITASGSAAGDIDTLDLTSAEGDNNVPIEIETNGASTNTIPAFITAIVEPT